MFVEDYGTDACGLRDFHPHVPGSVMVKQGVDNKSFAAVFRKCVSTLWLVAGDGFHADGDEGSGVVVVWAVHVVVGGNFVACFRLA